MTDEASEVCELRELVAKMPAIALEADTEAVSTDLDLLSLKD